MPKGKREDLVGCRFDKLLVVGIASSGGRGNKLWQCACDCGEMIARSTGYLRRHPRVGCRACRPITKRAVAVRHGDAKTHLHKAWSWMRQRCYQPSHPSYPYYGAKGIRLCHDWLVYENFRDWALANGYREGLTVDRLDSACNYEPGNCEWVTLAVNIGRRNTQHAASQRKALLG